MIECLIIGFGWLALCLYIWKYEKERMWIGLIGTTLMAVILCWLMVNQMPHLEKIFHPNHPKALIVNF